MCGKAKTYHIIGGGIAGLAAAKFIKAKNIKHKVIIYEAAARLGGRCSSFFDASLERKIDNATHVILGANKDVLKLIQEPQFAGQARFWQNGVISRKFWKFKDFILLSVFNTAPREIAFSLLKKLFGKLFPFLPNQLKVCYSRGDLEAKLIKPLSRFADEIKTGHKLLGVSAEGDFVSALKFNKGEVKIRKDDIVICALDAANYHKIFGGKSFEFNEITNIFYRTSTPLTLPENCTFLGLPEAVADWVFIQDDIVAVTISDSAGISEKADELARKIWLEIRALNGLKPAFLPPYRVIRSKRATIKQDKSNNSLRPTSVATAYKNLRLAGDWTMKDWPCCLEAAVKSAKRAVQ